MPRQPARTPGQLESLPLWAQRRIRQLERERDAAITRGDTIQQAHDVLLNREWFVLPGPQFEQTERYRKLWILNRDDAFPVCSLGFGDVLLVGRAGTERAR